MSSKVDDVHVALKMRILSVKFVHNHVEIECLCPRVQESLKFVVPRSDAVLERQLHFFVHRVLTDPPEEG